MLGVGYAQGMGGKGAGGARPRVKAKKAVRAKAKPSGKDPKVAASLAI